MNLLKFTTSTPSFKDVKGHLLKDSIAETAFVELGGIKQWILMRGRSIHQPILIFLHGGPGISLQGIFRYYNHALEDHFLVVGWDQRGTGKSYQRKIDPKSMSISQFVSDLHELVCYLKNRFGHQQVYIMGESWGSLLGILYAKKYPENLYAYIGIGQVTHVRKSELLSYEYTLKEANQRHNQKALKELTSIKNPGHHIKDVKLQRKWLIKFGGVQVNKSSLFPLFLKAFGEKEYALLDLLWFIQGSKMSTQLLWPQIMEINLFEQVPELHTPVYFLMGRHDYCVSTQLVKEYFDALKAPEKKWICFDNAGHHPFIECPESFNATVISVKKDIDQQVRTK